MRKVFAIGAFKTILILTTAFLAPKLIPYQGFFPYKDKLIAHHLPPFIYSLANFDGLHYLIIASEGYYQYQQAFFPLYPLLIRFVSFLLPINHLIIGLLISNISFFIGLYLFYNLSKTIFPKQNPLWPTAFLMFFPTAFFFHALYTESLFFMLLVWSLFYLKNNRFFTAAIFAALSSATRLMGIFLFIPFTVRLLYPSIRSKYRLVLILAPLTGLLGYMLYLWLTTGQPLFFFTAQEVFGPGRSTKFIFLPQVYFRYLKIFLSAQPNFQYLIAWIEFIFFNFVLVVCILEMVRWFKKMDYFYLSIIIISLINILLPSVTGSFLSIPRFTLLSLSVFFYLSSLKSRAVKITLLLFFTVCQIVLVAFFVQGYFIA